MERFAELLREMGPLFGASLFPDRRGHCNLNINDSFRVYIENESEHQRLLIGAFVCDIPPGKFRENVLKEALKANGTFPRTGIFAYVRKKNQLALYTYAYTDILNGKLLAQQLRTFIAFALTWKQAIDSGQAAPPEKR